MHNAMKPSLLSDRQHTEPSDELPQARTKEIGCPKGNEMPSDDQKNNVFPFNGRSLRNGLLKCCHIKNCCR